jgi:hypothetical protein
MRETSIGLETIQMGAPDDCLVETDVSPGNGHNMSYQKMLTEGGK